MLVQSKYQVVLLVLLAVITAVIYLPGLQGGFLFDDYSNIVENQRLSVSDLSIRELTKASLSGDSGPLRRPVSMFSFALNLEFCGPNPFCFKIVNLVIHILCGLLLFLFSRMLVVCVMATHERAPLSCHAPVIIAAATALIWLLHPINLTSVLYVVQRMNSLSALFVLLGLWLYVSGRKATESSSGGTVRILTAFLLTLPAVLSKENGALLPLLLFLTEIYFFQFSKWRRRDELLVRTAFAITLAIPAVLVSAFLILNTEWLINSYSNREFSMEERLLTQPRVLWFYIGLILLPSNRKLSLFHDDFLISESLIDPITTLFSVIGLAGILVFIMLARRKARLASFGLAFFLAGHIMESTVLPLEMVFEHRNYLPSLGLIMPLSYYLYDRDISIRTCRLRRAGLAVLILLFGTLTFMRAGEWSNPMILASIEAETNSQSARVNNLAGRIYAQSIEHIPEEFRGRVLEDAHAYFVRAHRLDRGNTTAMGSLIVLESKYMGYVQDKWPELLLLNLRNNKITASGTVTIRKLQECLDSGICSSEQVKFEELVKAVENNPNLSGKNAAIIYTLFSKSYWETVGDKEKALEYSRRAYYEYPRAIQVKMNYARILKSMGMVNELEQVVEKIRKEDMLGLYDNEIQDIISR